MPEAYLSIAIACGHDVRKAVSAAQLLGQRSSSSELPTADLSASAACHQLLLPSDATDVREVLELLEQDGEELCRALQCLYLTSCGESFEILNQCVRITVFCSAIVIVVIVHCHTAGAPFESNGRKQLSLSSCGWVLIRSGQFIITLVAELGIQPSKRSFWTETSAITFSTFSIAVTVFPSSTYGGDWSLSVDGACIIAFPAQCTGL